ncbi:MAG: biopolymer transporter ExbD [Candidatus Cloacimonetes bacterium]|jgi:biopolymer transport protein ExbD|nr:biopolymer transporter ExbD [Candidatus Cloacimonadota bacterium]MDD3143102.1 biopolymer transporter ExbD [Candidatus Cloacimonadota bacterium]MDY0366484.1 biopolymer transporter ExbD [Candidatus Syntrophosphaera sp.]HOY84216.1 biopolymer transporter ExbD [Candidatus Syntrophosphaera sp.]
MKLGISRQKISSTVLISMTDVIFLLLIFLLIASNFAAQTGLPFKLPGSVSQERQTRQVLHIQYQTENQIVFMDKTYTLDTLEQALKNEFNNPDQVVRLSAEKSTPLQSVINLMDVVRGAGFERVFVATEPAVRP